MSTQVNQNLLTPIYPRSSIKNHDPRREPYKNVSSWFVNEQIELDFGESVGRPSENILLQREYITKFLENGWTIDRVMSASADGSWTTIDRESSKSDNLTISHSSSGEGSSSSNSRSLSVSDGENEKDGPVFWEARQRVRLKRRRMQPEKVMQDMMESFTDQYNHGKGVDNERFNELMSLYSVVLSRNETEGNKILTEAIDPSTFLGKLYSSTWYSFDSANSAALRVSETSTQDAVNDINRQFDALVETKKAEMISTGMYNSTVWPSVAAGIERQRSAALVKAKADAGQVAAASLASVGSAKASAASAFMAAKQAIADSLDKRRITVVEMRNNVIKWILDFVGSREEVYPELEEISSVAERLGFSVGSAGNVL